MRGLYAIVDLATLDAREVDPLRYAEALLDGGASVLQLRDKSGSGARALSLLEGLVALARPRGALVVANDRVDLALLAGVDGVHLGQGDLPPARARELEARAAHGLLLGRSTHHEGELRAALAEPIDYVAVGPVASTSSKPDHEPVLGLDEARRLGELARSVAPRLPRVAIGGIDPALAARLRGAFDAVAVIGGLLPERGALAEVTERAGAFVRALEDGP